MSEYLPTPREWVRWHRFTTGYLACVLTLLTTLYVTDVDVDNPSMATTSASWCGVVCTDAKQVVDRLWL